MSFSGVRFTARQAYVALSRVKSLSGLHLENLDDKKIKVNKTALLEMERLHGHCQLSWNLPIIVAPPQPEQQLVVCHLSIVSYRKHHADIVVDTNLLSADIIRLTETYTDIIKINNFYSYTKKSKHGIAALVKKTLPPPKRLLTAEFSSLIETLVVEFEVHEEVVTVVVCYVSPQATPNQLDNALLYLLKSFFVLFYVKVQ